LQDQFRGRPVPAQVTNKLAEVGSHLNALSTNLSTAAAQRRMPQSREEASISAELLTQRLTNAMADLDQLLLKYTEIHPLVKERQSLVDELKSKLALAYTNGAGPGSSPIIGSLSARPGENLNTEADIIRTKLRSLHDAKLQLLDRQREAELFASS